MGPIVTGIHWLPGLFQRQQSACMAVLEQAKTSCFSGLAAAGSELCFPMRPAYSFFLSLSPPLPPSPSNSCLQMPQIPLLLRPSRTFPSPVFSFPASNLRNCEDQGTECKHRCIYLKGSGYTVVSPGLGSLEAGLASCPVCQAIDG